MTKKKKCRICASDQTTPTIRYNDWQVYRCRDCGFRFAEDGRPIVYEDHYDEDYFAPLMQRDQMDNWARICSERRSFLRQNAPSGRLLEAGAGASTFALNAVEQGFEVTVADAAPWAVDFLSSHDGVTGQLVDLNQCDFPSRQFGAIHCSHVLEHLREPRQFLQQCLDTLQPGGVMYLSFPAYEGRVLGLRDGLFRLGLANHPYNYQAPDHLSYFDASCIRATLEQIGFEVVRLRRIKFVSVFDTSERMDGSGLLRKMVRSAVAATSPVSRRIGFHRDLEIIARRPVTEAREPASPTAMNESIARRAA